MNFEQDDAFTESYISTIGVDFVSGRKKVPQNPADVHAALSHGENQG